MAAYVIAEVEVVEPEGYKEYLRRNSAAVERHGGRFVVRGGKLEVLEGERSPQRLVVMEFPSFEQAKAWYDSAEYQEAAPIRRRHARTGFIAVVEGA